MLLPKRMTFHSSIKWTRILIGGLVWSSINLLAWWYLNINVDKTLRQVTLTSEIIGRFEKRKTVYKGVESGHIISEYQLLKPRKISLGKKYPLVIFLHGSGMRGNDGINHLASFPAQMSSDLWYDEYPCFLIAPQCPENREWGERSALVSKSVDNFDPLDDIVVMIHEVSRSFPVDMQRIYLTGYSMGAYGVWNLAAREHQMFAAIVPLSGGGDTETARQLREIPIWAFGSVVPSRSEAVLRRACFCGIFRGF